MWGDSGLCSHTLGSHPQFDFHPHPLRLCVCVTSPWNQTIYETCTLYTVHFNRDYCDLTGPDTLVILKVCQIVLEIIFRIGNSVYLLYFECKIYFEHPGHYVPPVLSRADLCRLHVSCAPKLSASLPPGTIPPRPPPHNQWSFSIVNMAVRDRVCNCACVCSAYGVRVDYGSLQKITSLA